MIDMKYSVLELKEENGELWARIKLLENKPEDLALASPLQELARRIEPYQLSQPEALTWILTIPGLDDFFCEIVAHKKRILQ